MARRPSFMTDWALWASNEQSAPKEGLNGAGQVQEACLSRAPTRAETWCLSERGPPKADFFRSLVKQLELVHDSELAHLRLQNEELRLENTTLRSAMLPAKGGVGSFSPGFYSQDWAQGENNETLQEVFPSPTASADVAATLIIQRADSRTATPCLRADIDGLHLQGDSDWNTPDCGTPGYGNGSGGQQVSGGRSDPSMPTTRVSERHSERVSIGSTALRGSQIFPPMLVWVADLGMPTAGMWSIKNEPRKTSSFNQSLSFTPQTWKPKNCIAYPGSTTRLVYELIGGLLILYDLINVPMLIAFNPPPTHWGFFAEHLTLIWWTLSMPASLTVGYIERGETIMDPWRILVHYLRTWFFIDLAIVVPDWIILVLEISTSSSTSPAGSSTRLLRIMRFVRLVRLLRLPRLQGMLRAINDSIDSEYLGITVNISKMMLILAVINHLIACVWYLIGDVEKSAGRLSWIEAAGCDTTTWEHQYAIAFHWSITQFTPASMHIQPVSLSERIFTIFVVLFALVGFSYVVGSITGGLSQLRSMQEDTAKQFWLLRRYLKQEHVSKVMVSRIQRFLEHRWQRQLDTIPHKQVGLLSMLSEQLAMELRSEIVLPHLTVVPLFRHLEKVSRVTLFRLANQAISQHSLAIKDTIFHARELGRRMSILSHGKLEYCQTDNDGEREHSVVRGSEDWIAEPVLWTPSWHHCGDLTAVQDSELLQVNPTKFASIVQVNPEALDLTRFYAKSFLDWLNSKDLDCLSDVMREDEAKDFLPPVFGARE